MITRRQFIGTLLTAGISLDVIAKLTAENLVKSDSKSFFISAAGNKKTGYQFSYLKEGKLAVQESPFRGHGISQHPLQPSQVIMYARRPGKQALVTDILQQKVVKKFSVAENRFFYGHGCFSLDGKTLFTTEGDVRTGEGKIGIRDAISYQQIGEFSTHGVGPHDIRMMPDGKTLVVANGGILTRPETGRKKLNLPDMVSSLTYIDAVSGQKVDEFRVAEPKASIRHIDIAKDGTVAIAMQVQRSAMSSEQLVPLGAIQKIGKDIQLLAEPNRLIRGMNDYMGSVVINDKMRMAGFTSPRGDLVGFWDIDSYEFKGHYQFHDVCGIATNHDQTAFVLSNSLGSVRTLDAKSLLEIKSERMSFPSSPWDNHMLNIQV